MDNKFTLYESAHPLDGIYKNSKTKLKCAYIKKADMEKEFPAGGYTVVGQIGKGSEQIGVLSFDDKEEPVYKTQKVGMAKIIGFIEIDENKFLAVQKSTVGLLLLILFLVALLCGLCGFLIYKFWPEQKEPEPPKKIIVDVSAEEGEGKLEIPEKTDTANKQIQVTGGGDLHFKAGQVKQNAIFTNPKGNPCFFEVQLILADTKEVIYTSDLVPPGYSISEFSLTHPLKAGEYKVTIVYNTFSFDKELRPLNNGVVNTRAIVE